MEEKTLREICNTLGVSRRAVQGYEKAGLVSPSSRNKYGHLLYDEEKQKRIELIKFYQQIGFQIKEIKVLMEAPIPTVKARLEKQALELSKQKTQIESLIEKIYRLLNTL